MGYLGIVVIALVVVLGPKIWQLFRTIIWRPYRLTKIFEKQGIRGPPYKLLYGSLKEIKELYKVSIDVVLDTNCNDITQKVLPHYHKWSSEYGSETILYWLETQPRITIEDPELAKQILSSNFGYYVKPEGRPLSFALAGKSLALLDGIEWVRRRRILNPAFSMEKIKVMSEKMAACIVRALDEWKEKAVLSGQDRCVKLEMNEEFQKLSADIIAHTAFGTNYFQGKEAFTAQKELQKLVIASWTDIFIPGSQFLPTPTNVQMWKLDRKLKNSLRSIVESRMKSQDANRDGCYGGDLLGVMIEASRSANPKSNIKLKMDEIVDECKLFFFAGHETTANLLAWTIFLLSLHKEWQERARQEVLEECGMGIPDADMLPKLKLVNMVLLETLRLYGPTIENIRVAAKDMKLGNLMIPKGTCLTIPVLKIHRSKKYWGEDAEEFNPLRFINGVSKAAKHPNAFLAFSIGPRVCIGQSFAMLEARTMLALILQRFSFSLSSDYKHAPANFLTLQPQHGIPVIMKPFDL